MLKPSQFIIIFSLSLMATVAHAQPKNIQLEYDLARNGKLFAKVKETFTQNGKQYRIKSVTKGIGVYALFGVRKLISEGTVTSNGLQPSHFELHQGDNAKKSLITDFDWPNSKLSMQVKGKTKTAALENGTQDLLSYAYQFMFNHPRVEDVKVSLTTGKKLNHYQYKIMARGLMLEAAKKNYKTLHLSSVAGADNKQLWLAEDQHYLPVRYTLTDENGDNFEQTLTKINVE